MWIVFKVSSCSVWKSLVPGVSDGQIQGAASVQCWRNQVFLGYQVCNINLYSLMGD